MAALTLIRERGPHTVAANPIYAVSGRGLKAPGEVIFEVLAADAQGLRPLVGARHLFSLDGWLFWADFVSLEQCVSSVPGLELLRDWPALRGVMHVVPDESTTAAH